MSIDTPKVSIVTLLAERASFIPLIKYCVDYQTYPKSHLEWIILDDGVTDKSKEFDLGIATYVKLFKKFNIGRKRQIACDIACGEFIIFFDDDDIHLSHRIATSVNKLQKIGARYVAGNSKMMISDLKTENIYEVGPYHKNHCTAGTMCFRKEIFSGTSFRESDKSGEEAFFLKNWKIPVIQLNMEDTIICLGHNENTISKNRFFDDNKKINSLSNYGLDNELLKILKKIKKNIYK